MTDRQWSPFNTSGVQSPSEAHPRPRDLESGPCSKAHDGCHPHQLALGGVRLEPLDGVRDGGSRLLARVAADDVDELSWFGPDELPGPDELAFENVPLVLSAWRVRRTH